MMAVRGDWVGDDPGLAKYISSVNKLPRLTREEELKLTRAWKQKEDRRAADQIMRAHLRYVVAIALKYRRYSVSLSDLIAEGNVGLFRALKKFEPERGNRFVTYASYWIRAYVLEYVIRSWSLVGAGSGALRSKTFFKLRRERIRAHNLVGDGEEASELLAKRMDVSVETVRSMLGQLEARDLSLETRIFEDVSLMDTLVSTSESQEESLAAAGVSAELKSVVQDALGTLDKRERYIVENRLMADREDELTLAELGQRFGVSRERARQLEVRAKDKLKVRLGALGPV
ncbi:hypothetical protein LCGC14_0832550 [marine sediment metagenome]|uniref:RNA polymerase sigma-70 domain-containing protein n=1 Tax=marine sediment metagenome TaxID=412755 RepID=A0A0F9S0A3_9ZZZZ